MFSQADKRTRTRLTLTTIGLALIVSGMATALYTRSAMARRAPLHEAEK